MARPDITMTDDEIAAFLDAGRTLQVATIGRDGRPHLAPMWYVIEDGRVVFRSFTKSQKIVNLRRNPAVTVLVEAGEAYHELRGVMIQGTAILDDDRDRVLDVYGKLAARYPMIGGEPLDLPSDALEGAFGRFADKNTVVTVDPGRIVTWDHTKLDGAY